MNGTDLFQALPDDLVEAQDKILEAVERRWMPGPLPFMPLKTPINRVEGKESEGYLFVMAQPLALGDVNDHFHPSVTARTAQRICDELGLILPTTHVIDLIHMSGIEQPCHLQPADPEERARRKFSPHMDDKMAMLTHSLDLLGTLPTYPSIADNCGKHWVLTNKLLKKPQGTAANYGWFASDAVHVSASGHRIWQPLQTGHNWHHVDYSQLLQALWEWMVVDGQWRLVKDVAASDELCHLVSSEGPLRFLRYPISETAPTPTSEPLGFPRPIAEVVARTLRTQARGVDVEIWQKFLTWMGHDLGPHGADGVFGGLTSAATREFQRTHSDAAGIPLTVDGVVGKNTKRAADQAIRDRLQGLDHERSFELVDSFMEAKNQTKVGARTISWIVVHTAEIAENATSAEALGRWVSGENAPRASWHYAVDCDSIVQSVEDENIAWHAPGANQRGIGIEHAGYAAQTPEQWDDPYSREMLALSARLVAVLCKKHGIPIRFVDSEGLKRGDMGITTHLEVAKAFKRSTHVDPGPHFPMDRYLSMIEANFGLDAVESLRG